MKHVILTLIFAFVGALAWGQTFEWARKLGGDVHLYHNGIVVDTLGNVYTVGSFQGTVDFDPSPNIFTLTSSGDFDIFISKLDAAGNFVWAKRLGDIDIDVGYAIVLDINANLYITGFFSETVDFDPGQGISLLSSSGDRDIFISKLDANGDFLWAKKMGGSSLEAGFSIAVDTFGYVYTTGNFESPVVDFDPGPNTYNLTPAGFYDIFISKLDTAGNFIWAKQLSGPYNEGAYSITIDASGNILTTGGFVSTVDFDPNAGVFTLSATGNNRDMFISKIDANGNFIWAKKIAGANQNVGLSLTVDSIGNIYSTGYYEGPIDFDPGPDTFTLVGLGLSAFVLKLDSVGNFVWVKGIESPNAITAISGYSITLDDLGNIFATGSFSGTVDFDPDSAVANLSSAGDDDIFVLNLDNSGNFIWAKKMGGIFEDLGTSIFIDNKKNIYTTGGFRGTCDFDPDTSIFNLTASLVERIFVHKITQCPSFSSSIISETACNSYTLNGQTYTLSGTYTQLFTNSTGCDSLITLHLTLQSTNTLLTDTNCISYTLNGQTYTTSGIYTQTFTNVAGCDSIITLNLTINNPTNDTIIQTACDIYTLNGQSYTSSGIYNQTFTNVDGCDSIITLNLTIKNSTNIIFASSACNIYVFNGQAYTSSGTYTQTFTNVDGCDSMFTFSLTINYSPINTVTQNGIDLTANASNVTYQWIDCNGNLPIVGATNQTFIPSLNGNYAVIVTENSCSDTSTCYLIMGLAVEGDNLMERVSLSPNPSEHISVLSFPNGEYSLIISDVNGKVIKVVEEIQGDIIHINTEGMANGVYFWELRGKEIVRGKMIVE